MKSLLTILIIGTTFFCNSQTSKIRNEASEISHLSHYGIDFELKNHLINEVDSALINSIDFDNIEVHRTKEVDTEVYLDSIDKTIILYSELKIIAIKNGTFDNPTYLIEK